MKGLILSAGMGTRLDPLTRTCPKCMVHVAGRPIMEQQLDALRSAGVNECTIVVGHMAGFVRNRGYKFLLPTVYSQYNQQQTVGY